MNESLQNVEFLESARKAVCELEAGKKLCAEEQKKIKEYEKDLEKLRADISREKEQTVGKKRRELEAEHDKKIRAAETELAKAEKKRSTVRNSRVNTKVKTETAGQKDTNQSLRQEIRRICKEAKIPGFCGSRLFLTAFAPRGFLEVLKAALGFLLLLVLIPWLLTLRQQELSRKILIFAVMFIIVVGVCILVRKFTVDKHREAISRCHDLLDQIRVNERSIRATEKSIRKDPSDADYDLGEYDAQIARLSSAKNSEVIIKQQELSKFDSLTAPEITGKIDADSAEKLSEAYDKVQKAKADIKAKNDALLAQELALNSNYTQYIGAKNMTTEALDRLLEEARRAQLTAYQARPVLQDLSAERLPEDPDNAGAAQR